MATRNSAVWAEAQVSAVLKHWDEEEHGHWDTSPATQERFSHKGGTDVYAQHLRTSSRKLNTRWVLLAWVNSTSQDTTENAHEIGLRIMRQ